VVEGNCQAVVVRGDDDAVASATVESREEEVRVNGDGGATVEVRVDHKEEEGMKSPSEVLWSCAVVEDHQGNCRQFQHAGAVAIRTAEGICCSY